MPSNWRGKRKESAIEFAIRKKGPRTYRTNKMNRVRKFGLVFVMCLIVSSAVADSLKLKNGSLVKGRFMGGDQNSINFQVGSSLQTYNVGDIRTLQFESKSEGADVSSAEQPYSSSVSATETAKTSSYVTI